MGLFMSKEDREEEKRLKKKMKEEEKELKREMKEFDEEYKKDHPEEKADIFSLLFEKEVDEADKAELDSYLTKSEKEELKYMEHENKVLTIKIVSALSVIVIGLISGYLVLQQVMKDDLHKYTLPEMEDYYANKFGNSKSIDDINELCVIVRNEKNQDVQVCSGIIKGTLEDGKHVMTNKDEEIGDDVSNTKVLGEYKDYALNKLSSMQIIETNPKLSYTGYYLTYNMYYDYIYSLPNKYSFDMLYNSGKLTVTDTIIYQGDFDYTSVKDLIDKLSDDSMFYFIKQEKGIPINLTIVSKKGAWSADVTARINVAKKITYYELSRNVNAVTKLSVSEIKGSDILLNDSELEAKKAYGITIKAENQNSDQPQKPTFYLLSFDNDALNTTNFIQFKSGYDSDYQETDVDSYAKLITFKTGGKVYMIGNSNAYIATTGKKTSWLCSNLGVC